MVSNSVFKAGQVITRENEQGGTAYVIERGRVEVTKDAEGKEIHLAYLYPGETFGEMSLIDDKPRSATVTAVEDTEVRVIPREEFFTALSTDPGVSLQLLRMLFERLREASATIIQLKKEAPPLETSTALQVPGFLVREEPVLLRAITPEATRLLPANPLPIEKFPFRIGRESEDPLVHNDLSFPDTVPYQLSRHHVAIVSYEGHIGVMDRGSTLGGFVNGQAFGGTEGEPGPIFFGPNGGTFILGTEQSPFRFHVMIGPDRKIPENWQPAANDPHESSFLTRLFHRRG